MRHLAQTIDEVVSDESWERIINLHADIFNTQMSNDVPTEKRILRSIRDYLHDTMEAIYNYKDELR